MSDFNTFVETLRILSKCKQFPKLTREWKFVAWRDGGDYGHSHCICGHKLKYEFLIKNKHNNVTLVVGSRCIKHFPVDEELHTQLKTAHRAAQRDMRRKRAKAKAEAEAND